MSKTNYPKTFWVANGVELLERAAYYAVFIEITLYLSNIVGFNDIEAGWISGIFSAGLYFLPTFTGALSDKIGFRRAILIAFALLTIAYTGLGLFPYKAIVLPCLFVAMIGGSFIKSIISGTVAKCSLPSNRSKAFSIFYAMVNIGSFTGKSLAFPIRLELGLQYVNVYSALMTLIAFIAVYFLYKSVDTQSEGKSLKSVIRSLIAVLTNIRLFILVIIITGFWLIQNQLYATMPKYVIRMVGEGASPEWIANINPLIVFTTVMLIQKLTKKVSALTTMNIGMLLMPLSAILMASGHILGKYTGIEISFFGVFSAHPITIMLIIGILFQGLAECFISPRYLEYFSLQAPKGEEGLYLGFSHLDSFFSSIIGFGLSGYLLDKYCPDPNLPRYATYTHSQMVQVYSNAHYIWYYFAAIGLIAAIALYIYGYFVKKIDSKSLIKEN